MRHALALAVLTSTLAAQGRPPNIVLVLADDLGYGDPQCYSARSRIPTPHIDRLAAEGLRFTDAHSPSSVCTPTRYGILTGRYAWRTGLADSVLWPWDPPLIERDRLTLPGMLRQHGYRTACIGKWHLGWDWPLVAGGYLSDEFHGLRLTADQRTAFQEQIDFRRPMSDGPTTRGFDSYFGDDVPNFPPYAFIADDRLTVQPTVRNDDRMFGHDGPMAPGWDLSTVLPTLVQHAASWIDEHARREPERPFFLYFPLTSPHTPIAPSAHWVGRTEAGAYGDYVAETDGALGAILDALERNDLAARTLVIFTSDNGSPQRDGRHFSGAVGSVVEHFDHDPSHPWRGLKADAWEGGHRVPFVVRWPEHVPVATTSDEPLVLTDLFRTLADLVGHELPDDAGEDSFDLLPALLDEPHDRPIRDHLVHHSGGGLFAIREGRWKLILGAGSGGFSRWVPPDDAPAGQLYDLAADPTETSNVYREHADVVSRLTERLRVIERTGRSYDRR